MIDLRSDVWDALEKIAEDTNATKEEMEAAIEWFEIHFYDDEEENDMNELLQKAYEGSYYTIEGCGGDLEEWKKGYEEQLKIADIGKPIKWIEFTGKDMNEIYNLSGNNRYQDDFHFLAFPLDGLNVGKLAMFKLAMGDRWFDDIVDNNRRKEEE